jgi:hypothetical protein
MLPCVWAIDFDGTICRNGYPDISKGILVKKAKEAILKMKRYNQIVIIWTCRTGEFLEDAKQFLDINGIPYDYINEPYPPLVEAYCDCRKIGATYYIDDCALGFSPLVWDEAMDLVEIED